MVKEDYSSTAIKPDMVFAEPRVIIEKMGLSHHGELVNIDGFSDTLPWYVKASAQLSKNIVLTRTNHHIAQGEGTGSYLNDRFDRPYHVGNIIHTLWHTKNPNGLMEKLVIKTDIPLEHRDYERLNSFSIILVTDPSNRDIIRRNNQKLASKGPRMPENYLSRIFPNDLFMRY